MLSSQVNYQCMLATCSGMRHGNRSGYLRSWSLRSWLNMIVLVCLCNCVVHSRADTTANIPTSTSTTTSNSNYTGEEFVSVVCSYPYRKSPSKDDKCSRKDLFDLVFCAAQQKVQLEAKWCVSSDKAGTMKTIYCLSMLMYFARLHITMYQENGNQPVVFPRCTAREIMQLSVEAVQNCCLSVPQHVPNSTETCNNGFSSDGFISTKSGDLAQLLIAKTIITLVSRPDQRFWDRRTPGPSIPCWQPDLQQAARLYDRPGRWDVDDACIDVFYGAMRKVLRLIFRNAVHQFNKTFKPIGAKSSLVAELIQTYVQAFVTKFLAWNFPNRIHGLREEASRRRSIVSGRTTVSCRKLKGTRSEVFSNLLTLARLVFVKDIRHHSHAMRTAVFISILDEIVPCALQYAV